MQRTDVNVGILYLLVFVLFAYLIVDYIQDKNDYVIIEYYPPYSDSDILSEGKTYNCYEYLGYGPVRDLAVTAKVIDRIETPDVHYTIKIPRELNLLLKSVGIERLYVGD